MKETPVTVASGSSVRRTDSAELLLLACIIALMAAAVLRSEPLQSANDRSRWCTVWSLVERGTWTIDEIDSFRRFSTIDKVRHRLSDQEPWHFYSSKPPLLSTIVAGLYWVERHTIGLGLFAHTHFVSRLLLVFVNLLPMTFALCSLHRCLVLLNTTSTTRLFVLATAGFGSMLNPYLTTLNNHTPAAICVIFCLTAMIRIRQASENTSDPASAKFSRLDFAILGCCAALSCCFELPAALFSLFCFVYAARYSVRHTAAWFVPAALVPLIAFFVTNYLCTGGLKPFYAYYGTDKYVYVHNGVPSYWSQPRGMDANQESWPVYLFHCVLGHHGIVSLSPVMLLTLAGWFSRSRRRDSSGRTSADAADNGSGGGHEFDATSLRLLIRAGAVLTVVTLGFYLTRTANYNYGGNSAALRWMLWLTPFWWFAMIPALEVIADRKRWFVCALLLLALSVFTAGWSQDRPWKPSWLFETLQQSGWIHYASFGTNSTEFHA